MSSLSDAAWAAYRSHFGDLAVHEEAMAAAAFKAGWQAAIDAMRGEAPREGIVPEPRQ